MLFIELMLINRMRFIDTPAHPYGESRTDGLFFMAMSNGL